MGQVNFELNTAVASGISAVQSVISNVTSQFIVSPIGYPAGVNGYVFDVIDDEEIMLDADITDSWLETNYTIQDHIALKPVKFTLHGFVGELYSMMQGEEPSVPSISATLGPLTATLPIWSPSATSFYNRLVNTAQQAVAVISSIPGIASLMNQLSPTSTAQEDAYVTFYGMWSNRILCTIQTPYGLLTMMAIESVKALQTGKSREVSDFSVTFKQIQQVGTASTTPNVGNPNPAGSATQSSPQDNVAPLTGSTVPGQSTTTANPTSTPLPGQTSIVTDDTAGRLGNAVVNTPSAPLPGSQNNPNGGPTPDEVLTAPNLPSGSPTPGVDTYPGTSQPVDVNTTFLNNSNLTSTATANPIAPAQAISVPTVTSLGETTPLNVGPITSNLPVPQQSVGSVAQSTTLTPPGMPIITPPTNYQAPMLPSLVPII